LVFFVRLVFPIMRI